ADRGLAVEISRLVVVLGTLVYVRHVAQIDGAAVLDGNHQVGKIGHRFQLVVGGDRQGGVAVAEEALGRDHVGRAQRVAQLVGGQPYGVERVQVDVHAHR